MNGFIYETILSLKYVGIVVLMFFFSGEAVMPFVGYTASRGSLNLVAAIVAGTIGSTLSSVSVYLVARLVNREKVTRFLAKHGKWLGITTRKINRAGKLFDTHARRTVFFGRFVPGIRTAVSVPAGYQRMPIAQFMFYTSLGSLTSSTLLALIGYYLRQGFTQIENFATIFTSVLGGCVVLFIANMFLKRHDSN